jgi:hypothetical protein
MYQGSVKKLRNEELIDLYSSPNIVQVVKSRRMRVAYIGFWWWNLGKETNWGTQP